MTRQDWIKQQREAGITEKSQLLSGMEQYRQQSGRFDDDPVKPIEAMMVEARKNPQAYASYFISQPAESPEEVSANTRLAVQVLKGRVLNDEEYAIERQALFKTDDDAEALRQLKEMNAERVWAPGLEDNPVMRAYWTHEHYFADLTAQMFGDTKLGRSARASAEASKKKADEYNKLKWASAIYEADNDLGYAVVKSAVSIAASVFQIRNFTTTGGFGMQSIDYDRYITLTNALNDLEVEHAASKQEYMGADPTFARELYSVMSKAMSDLFVTLITIRFMTGMTPWRAVGTSSKFARLAEAAAVKSGATTRTALKTGIAAERLRQASTYGFTRALLTPGSLDQRKSAGLITFAYMGTPAISGWADTKLATVVCDFCLNTGISYSLKYKDIFDSDMTDRQKFMAVVPDLVSDGFFSVRTLPLLRDNMPKEMIKLFAEINKKSAEGDLGESVDKKVESDYLKDMTASVKGESKETPEEVTARYSEKQEQIQQARERGSDYADLKELETPHLLNRAASQLIETGRISDSMSAILAERFPAESDRVNAMDQIRDMADYFTGTEREIDVERKRIENAGERYNSAEKNLQTAVDEYMARIVANPPASTKEQARKYREKMGEHHDKTATEQSFARDYARNRIAKMFGRDGEDGVLTLPVRNGDTAAVYAQLAGLKIPQDCKIGQAIIRAASQRKIANSIVAAAEERINALGAREYVPKSVESAKEAPAVEAPVQPAKEAPAEKVRGATVSIEAYHTTYDDGGGYGFTQRSAGKYYALDAPFDAERGTVTKEQITFNPKTIYDPNGLLEGSDKKKSASFDFNGELNKRLEGEKITSMDQIAALKTEVLKNAGFTGEVGRIGDDASDARELILFDIPFKEATTEVPVRPTEAKPQQEKPDPVRDNFMDQDLTGFWKDWTPEENDAVMRYYAALQERKGVEPPEKLPDNALEFIKAANELLGRANQILVDLEPTIQIGYNSLKNYFPMRLDFGERIPDEVKNAWDMSEEGRRVASHRKEGVDFERVKKDVGWQLRNYLADVVVLRDAGAQLQRTALRQNEILKARVAEDRAAEAKPDATKEEIRESLPADVKQTLNEWDAHKAYEETLPDKVKGTLGDSYEALVPYVRMVQDTGVGEFKKLFSGLAKSDMLNEKIKGLIDEYGDKWINAVDPFAAMLAADNGKIGANTRFWHSMILGSNNEALSYPTSAKQWAADLIKDAKRRDKDFDLSKFTKTFSSLMFRNREARKALLRARNAAEISGFFGGRATDADVAFQMVQEIKDMWHVASLSSMGQDMMSDVQKMSADKRRRFFTVEKAVKSGTATDEQRKEYLSYAPAFGDHGKGYLLRQATRVIFEKAAIDNGDIFSYYDSLASQAGRALYIEPAIKEAKAWADYLESEGHKSVADMWRAKIEHNLIGNSFGTENAILTQAAKLIKEKGEGYIRKQEGKGKEYNDYSIAAMLKTATPEDIHLRLIEAAELWQRARINRYLLGNLGWTFTTQWQSLRLTEKHAGIITTAKAALSEGLSDTASAIEKIFKKADTTIMTELVDVLRGDAIPSQSLVVQIKQQGGKDISAIEAAAKGHGQFAEVTASDSVRKRMRNTLNITASWMEDYTTRVSYVAGIAAAQKRGLAGEDAKLYGDYIAAMTQTMYDRISRNTMLNSRLLRAWQPMQSFVLTNMTNVLDTLGVVGYERSKAERMVEAVRWSASAYIWQTMISMMFGDDLEDAILDPTYEKFTIGSAIPYLGTDIDIGMSNIIPWRDSESWKRSTPQEKYFEDVSRIIKAIANGEKNTKEAIDEHMLSYVIPWAGFGGTQIASNFAALRAAKNRKETKDKDLMGMGRFESISGRRTGVFVNPDSGLAWIAGAVFGKKAVDEPSKAKKERKKKQSEATQKGKKTVDKLSRVW